MRARARGLSLTSTKCALPDSRRAWPASTSALLLAPSGGIELDRDDELLLAEHPGEPGLLRRGLRCIGELALADDERRGRGAILLDRAADRLDLCRRRAAAAADDAGAEPPRLRRELGEVVRGRVREDDAVAGEAREADVRERGEHEPVALHRGERVQGRRRAGAVVRARRGDIELDEPLRRGLGRDAAERLAVGVEGHQRDDWERRDAAHGLDRGDELVEVEERLEHEQVDAAALEDLRLLAEVLALLGGVEPLDVADRADRAGDVDVRARHLSGLAREAHRRRVDPLELVLEVVPRQLAPVGAERVRLDQLGAGADEARVQGDDALGRAQVRLLRAAQTRDCARDQRAHAAVGHDRRPRAEAVLEAARHPGHCSEAWPVNPVRGTSQLRKGDSSIRAPGAYSGHLLSAPMWRVQLRGRPASDQDWKPLGGRLAAAPSFPPRRAPGGGGPSVSRRAKTPEGGLRPQQQVSSRLVA